jgi:hypothetical protein
MHFFFNLKPKCTARKDNQQMTTDVAHGHLSELRLLLTQCSRWRDFEMKSCIQQPMHLHGHQN